MKLALAVEKEDLEEIGIDEFQTQQILLAVAKLREEVPACEYQFFVCKCPRAWNSLCLVCCEWEFCSFDQTVGRKSNASP